MTKLSLLAGLKLMLTLGGILAIAYLGICLFLYKQQHRMIFFPSARLENTPTMFDLSYEDVWLTIATQQGPEKIHGWWIPAAKSAAGVVLHLHGNGENIGANLAQAHRFHQMGFSVFLFDYRGYGLSDGDFPSEAHVYEDALAAWNYLVQTRGVDPEEILIYGHSLGGAIAIDLAVRQPQAAGVIVEGTFTSILEMANRTKNYGFLPISLLLTQRFDSIHKVRSLRVPLMVIHGIDDQTVPSDMSKRLYAAAPGPKDLLLVPGADHENVAEVAGADYTKALKAFMHQVVAVRSAR